LEDLLPSTVLLMAQARRPGKAATPKTAQRGDATAIDPLAADKAEMAREEIAALKEAIDRGKISWAELLRLSGWRGLDPKEPGPAWERKKFAEKNYLAALRAFLGDGGKTQVALYPGIGGVRLPEDGELQTTVHGNQIYFDWSKALLLIFRLDALATEAKEWWSPERARRSRMLLFWKTVERNPAAERTPHSLRAYSLATLIMAAIAGEEERHGEGGGEEKLPRKPSDQFARELDVVEPQITEAERLFRVAGQRGAQIRYGRGMVRGALGLAIFCLLVGLSLWHWDARAEEAVALATGGIGAIVSVLQRMTSNRLRLDFQTAGELLEAFGAVRPVIGAVFGMAVVALLQGGILPGIEIATGEELAFNAGIGFLAGFNERFAQDMLVGSAKRVSETAAPSDSATSQSA
jgi:hypothetical protein